MTRSKSKVFHQLSLVNFPSQEYHVIFCKNNITMARIPDRIRPALYPPIKAFRTLVATFWAHTPGARVFFWHVSFYHVSTLHSHNARETTYTPTAMGVNIIKDIIYPIVSRYPLVWISIAAAMIIDPIIVGIFYLPFYFFLEPFNNFNFKFCWW